MGQPKSQSPHTWLPRARNPTTIAPPSMADVLLVSKPLTPPWHDSSKNLVRDLAAHLQRYTPVVMSRRGTDLPLPRARVEAIYGNAGGFSPALRDNARVLARLLLGSKTQLWHFFFAPNPKTSRAAAWAARARRQRCIQTVCSAPAEGVKLSEVLFAERVVVLSEHTRTRFLGAGIAAERMALIRPSIVPLTPPTAASAPTLRSELGLPNTGPLVVYAGDLEFGRGADLALEAHADLPQTLGAMLVMACRAKTPRARVRERELRERCRALGIAGSTRFLGETPRIHALLAAADLVTLPSDTSYAKMDLPLVLVEAMSLERCVLVGEGTPAEELAAGGGAVSVATRRESVSAATRALLEDRSRRDRVGARARQVVLCDYDATRMATEYERVYDELCA
jgi:glycosyltransferase involved in cell wall biosynthesis